ncbi:DNA ligase D [Limoniibacter endophyticus]|uniref:DNA ligase (ATP) n=1 Tax=Limoniibacter endophyticus TaxID=1565040 RepID=A0A8J3GJ35_9HYPH|nr:DNA ligase D [Limoniibacter endophyticus]GHC75570.1 ATP-dependent DNA ligase [Limoniibacter endophyticus]
MAQLETYRQKRDFKKTNEPRGRKARASGNTFVIQKHDATRLHYDFRLEMDGVLKSWAVTKGPSLVPDEKRLAVHVEDHPLDYGSFEGTIPKGEYGGGTVMLWDRGTWEPLYDARKGYQKGHLEFELHGEKLAGRWHLVRMNGKPGEKRENWLLIKGDDEVARGPKDKDILEEVPDSVSTGRTLDEIAQESPGWSSRTGKIAERPAQKAARKLPAGKAQKLPEFIKPELATLRAEPPAGPGWIHEIKFDGYRLMARIEDGDVRLLTRSGLDWTEKFGMELRKAFAALPLQTAMVDGELVVEGNGGASDFSALQADLSEGRNDRFIFYAFDLLHLDGRDLRNAPLSERKQVLKKLVGDAEKILFSDHFDDDGDMVLRHACRLSLEGVVSKRVDAPYRSGRTRDWIKSKCSARQEFVIGGYVLSSTSDKLIGSLILGLHENGKLRHVGRVGTGFTRSIAGGLFKQLEALRTDKNPFDGKLTGPERSGAIFVKPEKVAEVEFRAWTGDGHLRHASFRGLREDKPAEEIVREKPQTETGAESIPKSSVKLSNPDRVYWPDESVTKADLADYYAHIWRFIAPHITGRALALLRCPTGITGQSFFQKHAWKGMNKKIRTITDPKHRDDEPLVHIADLDGLLALVQSAALEIHPWGSTIDKWEKPDRLIIDLDPGEGTGWEDVMAAAQDVRERLAGAGLVPFLKTSGGKGLHVVAPLEPKATWPTLKRFTKALADIMASDDPDRYVSTITKSKRKGKILIDYLRNQRGMTAVAPYSSRARPGAAVSMPLNWEDLTSDIGPASFTIQNAPDHVSSRNDDPWEGFSAQSRPLPDVKSLKG